MSLALAHAVGLGRMNGGVSSEGHPLLADDRSDGFEQALGASLDSTAPGTKARGAPDGVTEGMRQAVDTTAGAPLAVPPASISLEDAAAAPTDPTKAGATPPPLLDGSAAAKAVVDATRSLPLVSLSGATAPLTTLASGVTPSFASATDAMSSIVAMAFESNVATPAPAATASGGLTTTKATGKKTQDVPAVGGKTPTKGAAKETHAPRAQKAAAAAARTNPLPNAVSVTTPAAPASTPSLPAVSTPTIAATAPALALFAFGGRGDSSPAATTAPLSKDSAPDTNAAPAPASVAGGRGQKAGTPGNTVRNAVSAPPNESPRATGPAASTLPSNLTSAATLATPAATLATPAATLATPAATLATPAATLGTPAPTSAAKTEATPLTLAQPSPPRVSDAGVTTSAILTPPSPTLQPPTAAGGPAAATVVATASADVAAPETKIAPPGAPTATTAGGETQQDAQGELSSAHETTTSQAPQDTADWSFGAASQAPAAGEAATSPEAFASAPSAKRAVLPETPAAPERAAGANEDRTPIVRSSDVPETPAPRDAAAPAASKQTPQAVGASGPSSTAPAVAQTAPAIAQAPPAVAETAPAVDPTPPVARQTAPTVPQTAPTVPQTAPTVPQTPPTVSQTPPTVSQTPPTVPQTPPTVPQTPPTVSQTAPTVPQTPPAVVLTSPAVPQTAPTVPQTPPAVPQTPPTVSQTPPTVADTTVPATVSGVATDAAPAAPSPTENLTPSVPSPTELHVSASIPTGQTHAVLAPSDASQPLTPTVGTPPAASSMRPRDDAAALDRTTPPDRAPQAAIVTPRASSDFDPLEAGRAPAATNAPGTRSPLPTATSSRTAPDPTLQGRPNETPAPATVDAPSIGGGAAAYAPSDSQGATTLSPAPFAPPAAALAASTPAPSVQTAATTAARAPAPPEPADTESTRQTAAAAPITPTDLASSALKASPTPASSARPESNAASVVTAPASAFQPQRVSFARSAPPLDGRTNAPISPSSPADARSAQASQTWAPDEPLANVSSPPPSAAPASEPTATQGAAFGELQSPRAGAPTDASPAIATEADSTTSPSNTTRAASLPNDGGTTSFDFTARPPAAYTAASGSPMPPFARSPFADAKSGIGSSVSIPSTAAAPSTDVPTAAASPLTTHDSVEPTDAALVARWIGSTDAFATAASTRAPLLDTSSGRSPSRGQRTETARPMSAPASLSPTVAAPSKPPTALDFMAHALGGSEIDARSLMSSEETPGALVAQGARESSVPGGADTTSGTPAAAYVAPAAANLSTETLAFTPGAASSEQAIAEAPAEPLASAVTPALAQPESIVGVARPAARGRPMPTPGGPTVPTVSSAKSEPAAPATATQPASTPQADRSAELAKVFERVKTLVEEGQSPGDASIQTHDGVVHVHVELQGNSVTVHFAAEHASMRETINGGLEDLRQNLAQRGLAMGQVSVGSGGAGTNPNSQRQPGQQVLDDEAESAMNGTPAVAAPVGGGASRVPSSHAGRLYVMG